jgi:hypothetical protein
MTKPAKQVNQPGVAPTPVKAGFKAHLKAPKVGIQDAKKHSTAQATKKTQF